MQKMNCYDYMLRNGRAFWPLRSRDENWLDRKHAPWHTNHSRNTFMEDYPEALLPQEEEKK